MTILLIILNIIAIYIGLNVLYFLVFAMASKASIINPKENTKHYNRIAVFIPGYKEDAVIVDVAKKALLQSYPQDAYTVYIIADSFAEKTITDLRKLNVEVIEVSFEKSTKVKALNRALDVINHYYEIAVILDADNVMAPDFLIKINDAYNTGWSVIQGHRAAKNINSSLAVLDAVSEEVNNSIFRKGHRALGFSAALIGSGMAFDFKLYKSYMQQLKAVSGFDKELELMLLKDKRIIHYLNEAYVYDEKVSKANSFGKQRTRWLSAQIKYAKLSATKIFGAIFDGKFDYADKMIQFFLLPRVLLLGSLFILSAIGLVLPAFKIFILLLLLNIFTMFLAIPAKMYNSKLLKAIFSLPMVFVLMFSSLLKFKKANNTFIHTPHGEDQN